MSPAVLCGGDFSACLPLCFMSDSRCRMLMVISELRRQMKIQLKEGKMRLGSSLSSVYWYYQFPLQRQMSPFVCSRERHTQKQLHRNSIPSQASWQKGKTCLAKTACGREQLQRYLHRLISDPIPLFDYLISCWRKCRNRFLRGQQDKWSLQMSFASSNSC